MNNILLSCKLTDIMKEEAIDEKEVLIKRFADYEFYDGKTKSTATANVLLLGKGKVGELLKQAPAGKEIVAEGRMQIFVKERGNGLSGKDRRMEVSLARFHTN